MTDWMINKKVIKVFRTAGFLFLLTGLSSAFAGAESEVKKEPAPPVSAKVAVSDATDKPAKYFFYRCAGCHTVGGGKLSGPDLIVSTKWNEGDLKTAVKRMEKNVGTISSEEMDQIVQFLKSPDVAERIAKQKKQVEASRRVNLPPASFEAGQKLFRGQKALQNGGLACIACHRVGREGGTLGPDLTKLKDRMTGVALQSAIENSNFKIMRPIYEKRKITTEESLHLAEYLASPEKTEKRFFADWHQVGIASAVGFGASFGLLWLLNRQRKLSAKKNLFQRSIKR